MIREWAKVSIKKESIIKKWIIYAHSQTQQYIFFALGFCDTASWANCEVREKTNNMQQLDVY